MEKIIKLLAKSQYIFTNFARISIFIVMAWIGGLKAFQYEADGIVPFVINSPAMRFFYHNTEKRVLDKNGELIPEYQLFKNPEGRVVKKNIAWHQENGTYIFSYILGFVIVSIGLMIFLGIWYPKIGIFGALCTVLMSLVTLSFLITTPEAFVPKLDGDFPSPNYGFPYLSAAGRLVLKDVIMLAAALIIAAESASRLIKKTNIK
ncbi:MULTISPECIES: DUF417 family protein [Sphingobacterium]|jgi:uncharacterized membrane protein YkgB|uniref:DUF417 domain-containing protein n=1 Tax=Sphingobacterium multivorum TaxID=28454 RepID=A0A653Y4X2_SPHMU|nr:MULTISPECIES: DUF417 family protein [Sphingobacterium]HAE68574.1 DUF417 domain-containing protein [Sphingobacterium sp.]KKO89579.1 membrane protein [Sphingobacterium sp. Ag1]MDF2850681.1 hypothetical protein [Sphingobacterium multivorum]OFV12275.1 hypothetical protein HMPREF3127_16725 [Sphingobacterium sp. HMSC13C05]OJZ06991.1 MAG: hypothetical protein BGP15_17655 [Sphingobacterium sp. 40-24]